jgi:hypothetical protein
MKARNGDLVITACKQGGRSMGRRRSQWRRAMHTKIGDLVITDQLRSARQARHLRTTTGTVETAARGGRERIQDNRGDRGGEPDSRGLEVSSHQHVGAITAWGNYTKCITPA